MRKICIIFCVCVLLLGLKAVVLASPASQLLVDQGRELLFNSGNPTHSGLLAANTKFEEAISEDATDEEAHLFYAVTRLPALMDNTMIYTAGIPIENIRELLDLFGVSDLGRDIFEWTATMPENLPSDTPSSSDIQEFLGSVIIEEINDSLDNLAAISQSFEEILTASETGEDHDIEVDYGDVLLYESLLQSAKAALFIVCSYNLDADIDEIAEKVDAEIFDVNSDLLNVYTEFLKLLTGRDTIIGEAKTAVIAAIDSYDNASAFIRAESDPQWNDLISLDPEDEADEEEFRTNLADVKYSLENGEPVEVGSDDDLTLVDFSEFFDDPIHIRNYLPELIHDPYTDDILIGERISSFPDTTFSGIFPDGAFGDAFIDYSNVCSTNTSFPLFGVARCTPWGLAPCDVASLTLYCPGYYIDYDVENNIVAWLGHGTFYFAGISLGTPPEGDYYFEMIDVGGNEYSAERDYTPNVIDVVDVSTGVSPVNGAYVNTTTPTFSWTPVSDETIDTLYYSITIMDWNGQVPIYKSQISPDSTVVMPNGVLKRDIAYLWRVSVYDGQGFQMNNGSRSDEIGFSTGAYETPLSIEWASVHSSLSPGISDKTVFAIKTTGPAPDDVSSMTVTGPGGFSYTFNTSDFWQSNYYVHQEDGILADGTYTFYVADGRNGDTASIDKTFVFNSLPIPTATSSVPDQAYIDSTSPTFGWTPVVDETVAPLYYRIQIWDYSGKRIYASTLSTATTTTVPANILQINNPYYWRAEVWDSNNVSDIQNQASASIQTFFIKGDLHAVDAGIVLVWQDDTPGNNEMFFKQSTDGGATWTFERLTSNGGTSETPAIAVASSTIYVVWSDDTPGNDEIFLKYSTDGGSTWTKKRLTWTDGASLTPAVEVVGSNIYVVWSDDTPGNSEIYMKWSEDDGSTWTKKRLTWNAGESLAPSLAVYGSDVYVAWTDDTPGNSEIFLKYSTDGGSTWSFKRLSRNAGASSAPSLAADDTGPYIAWSDDTPGNDEIYVKWSTDGCSTWTKKRLSRNSGVSSDPSIGLDSAGMYVVWSDNSPGNSEIYLKWSTDNGASWEFKRLSRNSGESVTPCISADSTGMYITWSDDTPGNSEINVKYSTDGGSTWTKKGISNNAGESVRPRICR